MNRKPEVNRMIIENFILHVTHCDRTPEDNQFKELIEITPELLYQACDDYIAEDHVDGYDTDEEILINLWLEAEEANRNDNVDLAIKLKERFTSIYNKEYIDKKYVDAYLESVGA